MEPKDYLHLQMELEGIRVLNDDQMMYLSTDVDEFPLVLAAHTADEHRFVYFDCSLSIELQTILNKDDLRFFKMESAVETFKLSGIHTQTGHFKTYTFPDLLPVTDSQNVKKFRQDDSQVVNFGFNGLAEEVYVLEQDGIILSACVSSRQNSKCAEAWVFTSPDQRRKGFARQVVTAWAAGLQRQGIVPFYSHHVENMNSARLAGKLGLVYLFDEFVIEKAA